MNGSITSSMLWHGTHATGRMQVDRVPSFPARRMGISSCFLIIYPHCWRRLQEEMWNIYPGVKGLMGTCIMRTYQIWGYVMEVRGLNSIVKCINGNHSENKYQLNQLFYVCTGARMHACIHTCKYSCHFNLILKH